jgi:hypothetical protein
MDFFVDEKQYHTTLLSVFGGSGSFVVVKDNLL